MHKPIFGTLPFGTPHQHVVAKYTLQSDDYEGIGNGALGGAASASSFSGAGFDGGASNAYIQWNAQAAGADSGIVPDTALSRLNTGFTIAVKIETAGLFGVSGSNKGTIWFRETDQTSGPNNGVLIGANASGFVIACARTSGLTNINGGSFSGTPIIKTQALGGRLRGDYTLMELAFSQGYVEIALDETAVVQHRFDSSWTGDLLRRFFINARMSGTSVVTDSGIPAHYKELQILEQPKRYIISPKVGDIALIGDSQMANGNWPPVTTTNPWPYDGSISGVGASTSVGVNSLCAVLQNKLHRAGHFTIPYSFGVAGAEIDSTDANPIIAQINGTNAKQAWKFRPRGLIIEGGYNDLIAGDTSGVGSNTDLGFRATLNEACKRDHIGYIIILEMTSTVLNPAYSAQSHQDYVTDTNSLIDGYVTEYRARFPAKKFAKVGMFAHFGGHTPNPDYFQANDLHLNEEGMYQAGSLIASTILGIIN